MNEELYRELTETMREIASNKRKDYGFLGYNLGQGFSVVVPERPYLYRVTMDDGTYVEIPHRGKVAPIPRMRVVILYDDNGKPYIDGVDPDWLAAFNPNAAAMAHIGLHSHHRGSGMEFPIDWRLLYQLGPQIVANLIVRVVEGFYYFEGLRFYSGGTIDLAPHRPTSGQRWVVVGLNVSQPVHRLSVVASASRPNTLSLTMNDISQIPLPSRFLPLFAVRVRFETAQLRDDDLVSLYGLVGSAGAASANSAPSILDRIVTSGGDVVVDSITGHVVYI